MSLSATLKMASVDQGTVYYVDSFGGAHAFLAGPVAIRASDLPDPPPQLLHISLSWYRSPVTEGAGGVVAERVVAKPVAKGRKIAAGDRVEVVKSRVSGVKNPPEWLEQYVGRSGVVLWITADGAMVDLGSDTAWFAYQELLYRD